jgi:hypothetical protein
LDLKSVASDIGGFFRAASSIGTGILEGWERSRG